jgi:basic membrane protein A and related proteins
VLAAAATQTAHAAGRVSARGAGSAACLVVAADSLHDRSFDDAAAAGLLATEQKLHVDGSVTRVTTSDAAVSALRSCVRRGATITIAVGVLTMNAVDAVAVAYPSARFAIVDASVTTLAHRPANVLGLVFASEQAGYLAGYAAGLWAKLKHVQAVGTVGGIKIPPVDRYIAGFQYGAKRSDPGIKTLNDYSQDFVVQSKCKEKALAQIAQGSVVEFQVAGRCGLGVLNAAHEKGVFGIGTDADQSYLGPWVMTSVLERVNVAVLDAVESARTGTFLGGRNAVFDAQNKGVGVGAWSPEVPASIRNAVAAQLKLLEAGRIKGIPTTVT